MMPTVLHAMLMLLCNNHQHYMCLNAARSVSLSLFVMLPCMSTGGTAKRV